ncbi:phospho-acceptor domain-containing protein [Breoghania corrubedonensis]|uniref:histidine kinase n=1 Tax=Breoghania corrubedonensis TaxID=665038 RepID=A0A2T5VIG3_9HYPH|nr:ATP-binding protein [Breoghania corrubedonensis]PTW63551.1 phospho-acceptor domain-containing protein [Breoghania corrubedonensis]
MKEAETETGSDTHTDEEDMSTAMALAVIVHDIRTPLGAVSASADLLATTELNERQRSYVETLQQAAAALNDLATELLDQAGDVPPEPGGLQTWNPAEVFRSLTALFKPLADEQNVHLELTLGDGLDVPASGDPHAVRRILTNLVDNAIKFTGRFSEDGSVRIAAVLAEEEAHRRLVLTVSDDGPGIAADELPSLFLPYRQGASGQRLRSGSGLGLWISRTLARRLGGSLGVESELGHGTRFTLDIPCAAAEGVCGDALDDDTPSRLPEPERRLNVLVVDDNSVNRLLISTFLESFGMTFRAVESGTAALAAVARDRFDVVIMDLQMPGMDGIETALHLREEAETADIPIVALTAGMRPADTARYRRARFSSVLGKPFAPADLLKALTGAVIEVDEGAQGVVPLEGGTL